VRVFRNNALAMAPLCCPADGVGAVHVQCDRSLEKGVRTVVRIGRIRVIGRLDTTHDSRERQTGKKGGAIPAFTAPPLVSLHLDVKREQNLL
jgi:hypothetical protein